MTIGFLTAPLLRQSHTLVVSPSPYAHDLRQSQSSVSQRRAYFVAALTIPCANSHEHQASGSFGGICTPKPRGIAIDTHYALLAVPTSIIKYRLRAHSSTPKGVVFCLRPHEKYCNQNQTLSSVGLRFATRPTQAPLACGNFTFSVMFSWIDRQGRWKCNRIVGNNPCLQSL